MSDIPRRRAERLLQQAGLDALVLAKPESYTWATGAPAGVASFFRRAGAAMALVPADSRQAICAVSTELFAGQARRVLGDAHVLAHADWVETADIRPWLDGPGSAAQLMQKSWQAGGRPAGFARPAAFDARRAFAQLGQLLRQRSWTQARIGLDLDFWPVSDFALLQEVLPQVHWCDASAIVARIKAVKSTREIALLRQAAALAEAGMHQALACVRSGMHRDEIAQAWKDGVAQAVQRTGARLTGQWEYTTVGPLPWQGGGRIAPGDVLKFDMGCLVEGYSSDSGRTFVLGRARPRTREIMQALEEAFAAGLEVLRPGRLLSEVHDRATSALHRAGMTGFTRGHFGHSLGHDTFCEVPPFIAAQAHEVIEPGMVLAFETPVYVDGEGGFIIEDQFLITDDTAEPAWSLPRGLVELPP
ncbi:MAG: M24 family metallopeptidase [Betaproteobacteria bacterium]